MNGWISVIIDVLYHLIDAQDKGNVHLCEAFILPSHDQKSSYVHTFLLFFITKLSQYIVFPFKAEHL